MNAPAPKLYIIPTHNSELSNFFFNLYQLTFSIYCYAPTILLPADTNKEQSMHCNL